MSKFKVHDLVCIRNTNGHTTGFIADVIEPKRYLFYSFIKCKYLVMDEANLEPEESNHKFKKGDYVVNEGMPHEGGFGFVEYVYPQGWYLIRPITGGREDLRESGKYLWVYRQARPDSGRYWTLHEKKKGESEE